MKEELEEEKLEKVLFRYHSNVLDEIVVETMWAVKVDEEKGVYRLNNIPFYGAMIATDDEFFAEYDEQEEFITYRKTIKPSGNSIVLVVIMEKGFDKEVLRDDFKKMGCESEGLNKKYFSIEVLKQTDYKLIKQKLEVLEAQGKIEYAEPCLSGKHWEDIQ